MRDDFAQALTKARLGLLQHQKAVFICTVCLMLKQVEDASIKTAATDGVAIYYNPDFFLKTEKKQRITLLAHEAFHVALQHMGRFSGRFTDHDRFNRAADYVINDMLVLAGFTPIDNWLHDVQYRGMSTEQVYDLLAEKDQQAGNSGLPIPSIGDWGDLKDPAETQPGMTPTDIERHITGIISTAAQATEMGGADAGDVPADVKVFLESLLKPKLPMASHLRRFFTSLAKNDYSWRKINRRFKPMMLPGMKSEALTHIAFAYDMSGSVSDKDTQRYVSEVVGVMRNLKPSEMTLVQFDTEIKSAVRIKTLQQLANVELVGRGGTWIEPLMDWAKKHRPTALVVFTDGEYSPPTFNPGIPILWMIHGRSKDEFHCDFGTTIRFDV